MLSEINWHFKISTANFASRSNLEERQEKRVTSGKRKIKLQQIAFLKRKVRELVLILIQYQFISIMIRKHIYSYTPIQAFQY